MRAGRRCRVADGPTNAKPQRPTQQPPSRTRPRRRQPPARSRRSTATRSAAAGAPLVDAGAAAVTFSRPDGWPAASRHPNPGRRCRGSRHPRLRTGRRVRPPGDGTAALQRPPRNGSDPAAPPPRSGTPLPSAIRGAIRRGGRTRAAADCRPVEPAPARGEGARLSAREVLFGRRVTPMALSTLGLVAVLIGRPGAGRAADTDGART